jgi:hypothetical protein
MRKGDIKVLAEDKQQHAFIRQVLLKLQFNAPQIHKIAGPANETLGRTFVLKRFPLELRDHRKRRLGGKLTSNRLIVCLDADHRTVNEAIAELRDATASENTLMASPGEGVVLLIPKYEIETWLEYLAGRNVDENQKYPKRKGREGDIATEVARFVGYVQQPETIPDDAPPSLRRSVHEVRRELLGSE